MAQRARQPLEAALGDVVGVVAIERFDMQGDAGMGCQRLKEFAHQFGVERADLWRGKGHVPHQKGPPRQIKGAAPLGVIHRQAAFAIAADAALVAQRPGQGLAQGDAAVFDRVVIVDVQIALRGQRDVDQRMAGQLIQHVVEETDTGRHVVLAGPLQGHGDRNFGFIGRAGDLCLAHPGLAMTVGTL